MASKMIFRMENKKLVQNSKKNDLRVWANYVKHDGSYIAEAYEIDTIFEAVKLIITMLNEQKDNHNIKYNAFGLHIYNGIDWIKWYDQENNNIQHYFLDEYGKLSISEREVWTNEFIG